MDTYEMTFIVADEKDKKNLDTLLKQAGAKVTNEVKWGKRELAYPIRQLTSAYYFTYTFSIDRQKLQELKTKMNYDEKIIRYLILKIEK